MQRTWMKVLIVVAVGSIAALVTEDASAQGPIRRMFSRPFRRDNNVVTATATQSAPAAARAEAQPGGQAQPGGAVAPAAATTDANANRDANVRPATAEAEATTPAAAPQLTAQPTSSSRRGVPIFRRLRRD